MLHICASICCNASVVYNLHAAATQAALDSMPEPQTTINFFNDLADGTDAASGAQSCIDHRCRSNSWQTVCD